MSLSMQMKALRNKVIALVAIVVLVATASLTTAQEAQTNRFTYTTAEPGYVKNLIVMIPDGCGPTHITAARWYKGGELALDRMPSGMIRTYGADSIISDSAPAATAIATGYKTSDKHVGVLPGPVTISGLPQVPENKQYKPVATVLEAAKMRGMSVGIVATSNVQHATPAAFTSHWHDRGNYNEIGEQQVYADIDVVFGGGKQYLLPVAEGGKRTDGENLIEVLKGRGYTFVETREQLLSLSPSKTKVWGLFANDAMARDFDRSLPAHAHEPSLAEMTQMAISILSKNPRGFFLMVEGSMIDWSSHANDPVGVISEVLAFDAAVKVALDFAEQNKRTQVLAFTDHGNGGMSIGSSKTDHTYSKLPDAALVVPLAKAKLTGTGLGEVMEKNANASTIRQIMEQYYGVPSNALTDADIVAIRAARNVSSDLSYTVGPIISKLSVIGWTTTGHTGEDVPLYSFGPNRPIGLFENTDLARIVESNLRLNLASTDEKLYAEASSLFASIGATINIIPGANGVMQVEKDGATLAIFHFAKDVAIVNGQWHTMNGVVIYSQKTGKVYLPTEALKLVKFAS
ncbi:MAG: alkaline phosphatase [Methanomassiliicoccales archaeon]